ncbi:MAG TPA: NAD-dependent dehydratase [Flavobacteriales bacterium]|nr:NAD-dependent dehydratase [Flavobacteriales bacterium]HMR28114.1 NAD-dependent dehydratase [Flavobacteriales bacterium]
MPSLLIAGATGLVGRSALEQALADPGWDRVVALVRKPLAPHPRLEVWMGDPDLLSGLRPQYVDAVLIALGTTMRQVGGDRARFRHVDHDLVLGIGRWARALGVPMCGVVSAVGADARSAFFYNRVKGEMEAGLRALDLPALHVFHPSILTGPRTELRLGERIGIGLMGGLAPLLPDRYKPMPHDVLASALLHAARHPGTGVHVHHHAAIRRMAGQNTTD